MHFSHHHTTRRRLRTSHVALIVGILLVGLTVATILIRFRPFSSDTVPSNTTATNRDTSPFDHLSSTIDASNKVVAQKLATGKDAVVPPSSASHQAPSSARPSNSGSGCGVSNTSSILVVINKKHCFSPKSWVPPDLVGVCGASMRREAAQHMQQMMNAASDAGKGFCISSAYRSYATQVTTYNHWVAVNGSTAAADTVSARPGYSEHQTGLAADLRVGGCSLECFAGTSQYTWLKAHAADYGFIQRYPSGYTSTTGYATEQWHWRYIGVNAAQAMKARGVHTLEQYLGISGGGYN